MTAEQIYPSVKLLIQQVQDSSERKKLENLILGAVESRERRKARISALLDNETERWKDLKHEKHESLNNWITKKGLKFNRE